MIVTTAALLGASAAPAGAQSGGGARPQIVVLAPPGATPDASPADLANALRAQLAGSRAELRIGQVSTAAPEDAVARLRWAIDAARANGAAAVVWLEEESATDADASAVTLRVVEVAAMAPVARALRIARGADRFDQVRTLAIAARSMLLHLLDPESGASSEDPAHEARPRAHDAAPTLARETRAIVAAGMGPSIHAAEPEAALGWGARIDVHPLPVLRLGLRACVVRAARTSNMPDATQRDRIPLALGVSIVLDLRSVVLAGGGQIGPTLSYVSPPGAHRVALTAGGHLEAAIPLAPSLAVALPVTFDARIAGEGDSAPPLEVTAALDLVLTLR